ncbi:MAG: YafY family transcriptional regulator [Taibaiella sp.]|nr:YafY family transcriptional regulator [Taibaiella sp.]
MNRIDRLFGILTLLQSKKYVSAEKISQRFGISVRTVYRDIKALCEQGIPVSFEPARGYFIVQGFFLPPVSFTKDEANAMLLVQSIVKGFTDQSIQAHYATAMDKVKAVLDGREQERLEQLNKNIHMQVPQCFIYNHAYLSALQDAISAKTILEIDYVNKKEEVSRRRVEPVGLVFYALNWHIIGWCHSRQDYRDFRVSRILKLSNSQVPFSKTDHISLDAFIQELPVNY